MSRTGKILVKSIRNMALYSLGIFITLSSRTNLSFVSVFYGNSLLSFNHLNEAVNLFA